MAFVNVKKNIGPIDANLYTGPIRMETQTIIRTGTVVLDAEHGEFAKALWVSGAGNIELVKWDGTIDTFLGVPVGWFYVGSIQVNSAGTTAAVPNWGS